MGRKSRQKTQTIRQLVNQGVPLRQAVQLSKPNVSLLGASSAQALAGIGPAVARLGPIFRSLPTELQALIRNNKQLAALFGITAGGIATEVALQDGGVGGGKRGGIKGVQLIDAGTGLRLGVISRKKALRVLQRVPRGTRHMKTKFLAVKDGCVQVVNT